MAVWVSLEAAGHLILLWGPQSSWEWDPSDQCPHREAGGLCLGETLGAWGNSLNLQLPAYNNRAWGRPTGRGSGSRPGPPGPPEHALPPVPSTQPSTERGPPCYSPAWWAIITGGTPDSLNQEHGVKSVPGIRAACDFPRL